MIKLCSLVTLKNTKSIYKVLYTSEGLVRLRNLKTGNIHKNLVKESNLQELLVGLRVILIKDFENYKKGSIGSIASINKFSYKKINIKFIINSIIPTKYLQVIKSKESFKLNDIVSFPPQSGIYIVTKVLKNNHVNIFNITFLI